MSWTIFLLKLSEHSRDQEIAFTEANPRTICGYVQGLTRLGHRTSWQDERFALDRAASRLLTTINLPTSATTFTCSIEAAGVGGRPSPAQR